jgi:hypothetical protein
MEPDSALDPWAVPEHVTRQLPRVRRPRRPWWVYAGTTLVVLLWLAGVALVACIVLLAIGLSQWGNNK